MATRCKCCQHPDHDAIDAALVRGQSMRSLAAQYGTTTSAISRHRDRHLTPALAALAAERKEAEQAGLVAQVQQLVQRCNTLYEAAVLDSRSQAALAALREMRGALELLGKATGELNERPQVTINLMQSEEWLAVRAALFMALAQYPEARQAVAGQLLQLGDGS